MMPLPEFQPRPRDVPFQIIDLTCDPDQVRILFAVLTSKTGNLWLGPGDTARETSTPAPVLACPIPAASVATSFTSARIQ